MADVPRGANGETADVPRGTNGEMADVLRLEQASAAARSRSIRGVRTCRRMNVQEYVPTPPAPRVDFSDWNDPVLGLPVMAVIAIILALAVVLALGIAASRNRSGPPTEMTP